MKRLNISGQLITLFVLVMLIGSILFSVVTMTTVYGVAENEVYSRLTTYSNMLNSDFGPQDKKSEPGSFPDMKLGFRISKNGEIIESNNLETDYIKSSELDLLISQIISTKLY